MWFEGSVAEAIATSRQAGKPLLVLLTGFDQGSRAVQDALIEQAGEEPVAGCIALCLEDDLANTDRSAFVDAKNFRTFCPVERLPSVVMVSPTGAVLAQVAGVVPAAELRSRLAGAFAGFRRQQQQLAPAALAAAAGAALAAPAAPAAAAAAAQPAEAAADGGSESGMPPLDEITAEDMLAFEAAEAVAAGGSGAAAPAAPAPTLAAAAAAPAAVEPEVAPPPPPPVDPATVPYRLQFRFTDGGSFQRDFTGATLLRDVFGAVDEAREARGFRRHLAYLLVQTAPRLQLGAADEGRRLADTGVQPRTSLQVIPHAALGHQPPAPPQPAPEPQQQQPVAAEQPQPAAPAAEPSEAAAAPKAEQQRAAPAPPPPPAEVALLVRLSNGDSLRRAFPGTATLSDVLDWVDANRTDRGAYKLTQTFPARTFFSGDLGKSLQELGFEARMALQLELLPPAAKRSKFVVAAPAPAPTAAAAPPAADSSQARQAAPPPPPPGGFALQIKLLDGEALRGSFAPEAVLQEVAHYVDTNRTDGGAPYHLVQPFPRRRFGADDMQTPLAQLGFEPRQALLLEPAAEQGRGGWSLGGLLAAAKSWLNPYNYVTGPAGTAGGGDAAAAGAAPSGLQRGGGNVRTLHDGGEAQEGGGRQDEGNSYWNGNSTEFGAGPPPGQQ